LPLLLASASAIRHAMLEAAGVAHEVASAGIDEGEAKRRHQDPAAIAKDLAAAKAQHVSRARTQEWVIGSDSVVSVSGRLFDKPQDRDQAGEHLRFFSGKPMVLTSAVALARDGGVDWVHASSATLHVRPLSDAFIESYLDAEWPEVGYCVGVFRMEGRGVHLFSAIEGDHFTILGMPLLPLMAALRERGLVPA
jgi:septum formation protein